eukprot:TRINITY_DN66362_c0_g1_i1.p1 TRINITY_DN66362_c0_g1~~TRINITY_DN66362_c0_g1_i1.p1  ORF type:complete len:389 (-),score=50.00 TRINITY_DN66362_c0_g1_i1:302-1468(-)
MDGAEKPVAGQTQQGIRPAGREVILFSEKVFAELRAFAQVNDDFLNEGWSFQNLESGGGKGGTLMASVGGLYIVKEMSAGDHQTLLRIAGSYACHVREGETLLCPIYLHFQDVKTGRKFFAMRNTIGTGPFRALYDLKGCADDKTLALDGESIPAVHKRVWKVGMWCGTGSWSAARHKYFDGKRAARSVTISLLEDQRAKMIECIRRDTEWLASHNLMDYSLLVAITENTSAGMASGGSGPSSLDQRAIAAGEDSALKVSIIDFLQRYTTGKKVANCIKFAERNKATVSPKIYATRFLRHFEARLQGVPMPTMPMKQAAPSAGEFAMFVPGGDTDMEGRPEDRVFSRTGFTPSCSRPDGPTASRPDTIDEDALRSKLQGLANANSTQL